MKIKYFRTVMLEHNVLAVSKLYSNISIKSLSEVLGIEESKVPIFRSLNKS